MSPPDEYSGSPVFSPDGKKFAIQVADAGHAQIWLYDSSDGSRSRFTFSQSYNVTPRWSADGTRILFGSNRTGLYKLYLRDTRGIGNDELLYQSKNSCIPAGWSPDNQYMIFSEIDGKTKWDLWVLRLGEQRKVFPFLVTEANESSARFSPDGKWVAYASDESGRPEIYVQPFLAEKSGKWQISTNGGFTPKWSNDGKELFYLAQDNQIMCSAVKLSPIFEFTGPKPLFAIRPNSVRRISGWNDTFETAPDGRRFGVHVAASAPTNITVVLNWPLLLNQKK
jgi:eukaryotic-like serine/threonine-protein kinase